MFPSFSNLSERKKRLEALKEQIARDLKYDEIKRQAYQNALWATDNNTQAIKPLLKQTFSVGTDAPEFKNDPVIGVPMLGPALATKNNTTQSELTTVMRPSKIEPMNVAEPKYRLSTSSGTQTARNSLPASVLNTSPGLRASHVELSSSGAQTDPTESPRVPITTPVSSTPNYNFKPMNIPLPPSPQLQEDRRNRHYIKESILELVREHPQLMQYPFHPFNVKQNEFDDNLVIYSDGISLPTLYRYDIKTNSRGEAVRNPHYLYDWNEALSNMTDVVYRELNKRNMEASAAPIQRNLSSAFDDAADVKDEPMLGQGFAQKSSKSDSSLRLNKLVGRGLRGGGSREAMNKDHLQRQLGNKFVVLKALREGNLVLRYPSGTAVARKLPISQAVSEIIYDVINDSKFDVAKYNHLSNNDKKVIYDLFKITRYDQTLRKPLTNPYEIDEAQKYMIELDKLIGELKLGNRNDRNIKELCKISSYLYKLGILSDKQFQEVIELIS